MTTPSSGFPPGPAGVPSRDSAGTGRASVVVAEYPEYAGAQRAVDYLSDQNFPVQHTAIVGTDLRLVENVSAG